MVWQTDVKMRLVALNKSLKDLHETLILNGNRWGYWTLSSVLSNFRLPQARMREEIYKVVDAWEKEAGISTKIEVHQ